MPVINDRHYMNPQYGMAVERERIADEEHRRVHGDRNLPGSITFWGSLRNHV